jgi:Zn-dependent M28 family amino/carboxypeptidase
MKHRFVLPLLFVLTSHALAQAPSASNLYAWVTGIEGKSPEGRREFVKQELTKQGIRFFTMPFDTTITRGERTRTIRGENIIVRLGSGNRHIVVGAHMDAVPNSPGANDNGGGVAVLLGLLKTLKSHPWNSSIDFCFFDQEEQGLIGSSVYVNRYEHRDRHLAMINLDVVGMGEEIYVGPVGGGDDEVLMQYIRRAAVTSGYSVDAREFYPPSDWGSFARAKLENISISVVPKGDVDLLAEAMKNNWKVDSTRVPQVMNAMHTPNDKSEYVSPAALNIAFQYTMAVLLLLDQSTDTTTRQ